LLQPVLFILQFSTEDTANLDLFGLILTWISVIFSDWHAGQFAILISIVQTGSSLAPPTCRRQSAATTLFTVKPRLFAVATTKLPSLRQATGVQDNTVSVHLKKLYCVELTSGLLFSGFIRQIGVDYS
jgi:hypothetical protein